MSLLQAGKVFLSLMLHQDVAAMCHACVLWEETPHVFLRTSTVAIWEELWHSMPQSGQVSVIIKNLLKTYKERCTAERKRPRHLSESPAPLLPVSFSLAKDWLLKQQKAQSEALQTGAVNEDAQEVIADLSSSLAEQPASTAPLLQSSPRQ